MDFRRAKLRRQQLDRQLAVESVHAPVYPQDGWLQTVREALAMSLDALGSRLGMTRQGASRIERAEVDGSITLKRLRTAAEALNCDLVFYLRPRQPLEDMVRLRAIELARAQVKRLGHSMAMEDQAISQAALDQLIEETAEEIIRRGDSRLWA
ncbi:MAG: mobile mystery protein A [Armatimonadetes bacterium]|nr:mobile mystery protein A [Armatimonadota bacterium]